MNTDYQTQTWSDELLTGTPEIDEQHHMLANMLDEAKRHLTGENRPDQVADLIHDLMSYALYHFETEEALMLKYHYDPEQQALHVQEHRTFSAKVADIQKALSQGKSVSPDELLRYLYDWLHNHILNIDKQLGQFLATTSGHTS